jgi:hypothetical protein
VPILARYLLVLRIGLVELMELMESLIASGGWCSPTENVYDLLAVLRPYRVDLNKYHYCVACDENPVTSRGLTCTPCWHLAEVEAAIHTVTHSAEVGVVDRDVAVRLLIEIERLRERVDYLEEYA